MVQHIEGFQPKSQIQTLVNWKYAGDLGIELVVCRAAERVSFNVSVSSIPRHTSLGRWVVGTSGRDLSESSWVQITTVCCAGSRSDLLMKIDRNSRNQVRAIVANIGEGVVLPRRHSEWGSALDMHQRRKFPIIDEPAM